MAYKPFVCKCGCSTFFAHQVVHMDVKVNGFGSFEENATPEAPMTDIYYADEPFGPYQCTQCGTEYDELKEQDE